MPNAALKFTQNRPRIIHVDGIQYPISYMETVNVRDYGATGDGVTDDTAAIQEAFNAINTTGFGGRVFFPRGTYYVSGKGATVNNPFGGGGTIPAGFVVGSNTEVWLDPGATIQVATSATEYYSVFWLDGVTNVRIHGGRIIGDGDTHSNVVHEHAMGVIAVGCTDVVVRDIQISKVWGDGVYVGENSASTQSQRVSLYDVYGLSNHRNGISVSAVTTLLLSNTNWNSNGVSYSGGRPGIDIEPNANMTAQDITIIGGSSQSNTGSGIILAQDFAGGKIKNCRIFGHDTVSNAQNGYRITAAAPATTPDAVDVKIFGGKVKSNTLIGMDISSAHRVKTFGMHFELNGRQGVNIFGSDNCLVDSAYFLQNGTETHNTYAQLTIGGSGNTGTRVTSPQFETGTSGNRPKYHWECTSSGAAHAVVGDTYISNAITANTSNNGNLAQQVNGATSAGTPEGSIVGTPGQWCADTTNGELYVKNTGTGNTGWKKITHA